jgi:oxygen-independent coproporphyrinogen-3 oxidase
VFSEIVLEAPSVSWRDDSMTSSDTVDAAVDRAAVYVHIPFCARVCPYCDFNVIAGRDDLVDRYTKAVVAEVGRAAVWRTLDAIAFGGGTPSRMPASRLHRIIEAINDRFGLVGAAEISLEANPEDWSPRRAAELREAGFTRVSFGVQSFDQRILSSLGRIHTPSKAVAAVVEAIEAGFLVNIDLIFGTPGETLEGWIQTVRAAIALEPDHLSTYALTVERGTPLSRAISAGAPAPDEDLQAAEYEAVEALVGGLERYEVSNYARPGRECVYNLITWSQGEYLGFGAGAHGHRNGVRTRNVRRIDAYLDRVEQDESPIQGTERLDPWGREQERLVLGLRRTGGVIAGRGGDALLGSVWGGRLVEAGVIARRGDRIMVLRPLLTDEVSRAVLALSE